MSSLNNAIIWDCRELRDVSYKWWRDDQYGESKEDLDKMIRNFARFKEVTSKQMKDRLYIIIDQMVDQYPDVAERVGQLQDKIDEGHRQKLNQKLDFLRMRKDIYKKIATQEAQAELVLIIGEMNAIEGELMGDLGRNHPGENLLQSLSEVCKNHLSRKVHTKFIEDLKKGGPAVPVQEDQEMIEGKEEAKV
jgi:hypothetical protein